MLVRPGTEFDNYKSHSTILTNSVTMEEFQGGACINGLRAVGGLCVLESGSDRIPAAISSMKAAVCG